MNEINSSKKKRKQKYTLKLNAARSRKNRDERKLIIS